VVEVRVHQLLLARAVGERDPHDLIGPQSHHLAEIAVVDRGDRLDAEPGGQDPVVGGRCAPRWMWPRMVTRVS
jgi:hypothetical protein